MRGRGAAGRGARGRRARRGLHGDARRARPRRAVGGRRRGGRRRRRRGRAPRRRRRGRGAGRRRRATAAASSVASRITADRAADDALALLAEMREARVVANHCFTAAWARAAAAGGGSRCASSRLQALTALDARERRRQAAARARRERRSRDLARAQAAAALSPDAVCFASVIVACAQSGERRRGRRGARSAPRDGLAAAERARLARSRKPPPQRHLRPQIRGAELARAHRRRSRCGKRRATTAPRAAAVAAARPRRGAAAAASGSGLRGPRRERGASGGGQLAPARRRLRRDARQPDGQAARLGVRLGGSSPCSRSCRASPSPPRGAGPTGADAGRPRRWLTPPRRPARARAGARARRLGRSTCT